MYLLHSVRSGYHTHSVQYIQKAHARTRAFRIYYRNTIFNCGSMNESLIKQTLYYSATLCTYSISHIKCTKIVSSQKRVQRYKKNPTYASVCRIFFYLFSRCMNRDIYLLRTRNPLGINLCGGLGIVASDRVEIVIDGFVRLVGQQTQTA